MPIVAIHGQEPTWENYHKTGTSRLRGRFALRSGDSGRGRDDLREAAADVQRWLQSAKTAEVPVRPVGGAWSPSNIQTVQDGWMLNTRRFNRCFRIAATDLLQPAAAEAGTLLLAEGGVQIDEINDRLETDMHRSLRSTGASNGQTLAGACATGTHGSVIGAGGIQDHVRAVQVVTPAGAYWIEPSGGLMSDQFIAECGSVPVRDDEAFEAALVAVGSLGIVTAMVIETDPIYLVRPVLKLIDFRREDLEMLGRAEFAAFSERHGSGGEPYFVMVITNPFKPFGRKAVVRFLYRSEYRPDYPRADSPAQLGAGYDAFSMLGWLLRTFPLARGWILQTIMKLAVGRGITDQVYGTWGETTETHKPLANLFTGAINCERANLARAYEPLCRAFTRAGGSTVVTLRFLKGGHGLLSPARWGSTVAIDCDGPGGRATERAYLKVAAALDAEGIPFTCHWGKFNRLDAARVARDYGEDLVRWKTVRDRLLPGDDDLRLFSTPVLDRLGLTTRP